MTRGVKVNLQPPPTYDELLHEVIALRQQVANLEEYMLKGVAFRDELHARLAVLEKDNQVFIDEMPGWIACIKAERIRQDEKWGEQNHDDFKWLSILVEEVGELAKAILENDPKGVEELVHCAAVAVQWFDAIGRRAALDVLKEGK